MLTVHSFLVIIHGKHDFFSIDNSARHAAINFRVDNLIGCGGRCSHSAKCRSEKFDLRISRQPKAA